MDPRRLLPVLTALAGACVVVTLVVTVGRAGPQVGAAGAAEDPAAARERGTVEAGAGPHRPAGILATWDARRASAWADGDIDALAGLYVPGSPTGAADVRLLRDYGERGLRVEGLTTQVLALKVAARTSARLVLVVTDRVVGGEAVGGASPIALPADRASTRRIVMVRVDGQWRVAEVGTQASAAASTSRTSSSSKS